MSANLLFIVLFALYSLAMLFFGWLSLMKSAKSANDYFLAGKGVGFVVFAFGVCASIFSSWMFLGNPATIWTHGLAGAAWFVHIPLIALGAYLLWYRVWIVSNKHGFTTSGEILGAYFDSKVVQVLVAILAILYAVPYIILQMWGAGHLINTLSGGLIAFKWGAYILAIVMVFYVMAGGMKGTAWTSAIQGFLLLVGFYVLLLTVMRANGYQNVFVSLADNPEFITMPGVKGTFSWQYGFTYAITVGFGIAAAPVYTLWVNSVSVSFNKINKFYNFWMLTVFVGATYFITAILIGLGGKVLFPTLAAADSLVPAIMATYMPAMIYTVVGIAAVAAAQSTAGLALQTATTCIIKDIYMGAMEKTMTDKQQTRLARVITFVLLIAAMLLSENITGMIAVWGGFATSFGLMLVPAWFGALFWPKLSKEGVTYGMIIGTITVFIMFKFDSPLGIHFGVWGLIVNFATAMIISSITQLPSIENVRKFHGVLKSNFISEREEDKEGLS